MPVSHEIQVVSYSGRVAKRFSLSDWDGLEYDSVFNDIGTFALSLVGGPAQWVIDNLQLPRPALHFFVDVFRLDPMSRARERDRTFLYQYLEYGHDVDGVAFATLGGYDLNWLLLTRLVDVRLDPDETGGFLVLSGPASELMSRLVRYNGGDLTASIERMWPRFEVFADGTGFPAGGEYRFDVLLEVIQALALAGRVQFLIRHAGGGELQLHVGSLFQDRTVERKLSVSPLHACLSEAPQH